MIDTDIDRRPKGFSVRLAGFITALVALVVAASMDLRIALWTLFGLAGSAGIIWSGYVSIIDPSETENSALAKASIVLVMSVMALLVPLFRLYPVEAAVVYPFVLAVLLIGISGTGGYDNDQARHLTRLFWRSRDVVAVGAVVAGLVGGGAVSTLIILAVEMKFTLTEINAFLSVLSLEALVIAFIVVMPIAQDTLEDRLGSSIDESDTQITVGGGDLGDLFRSFQSTMLDFWWVFALQIGVFIFASRLVDQVLDALPGVGDVLLVVLSSGVLHFLVGALVLIAGLTIVGGQIHKLLLSWASFDPPRDLASSMGGLVFVLLSAVVGVIVPMNRQLLLFPAVYEPTARFYGPVTVVLVSVGILLFFLPLMLKVLALVGSLSRLADSRSSGFLMASLLALIGTVMAGIHGVPAFVVFGCVAATIIVWDLGENASFLGSQLGAEPNTREAELVHGLSSIAVGVVGILLATGVGYFLGPVSVPTGSEQAVAGIALALLAALSFALAADRV